jgi:hypothetical protein
MPIGRGVSISTVSQAPSGLAGPGRGVGIPNMINMIPTMGRGMPNIPMNPPNMPGMQRMPPPNMNNQMQPNMMPQGNMINNMSMPPNMRPPPQMINPMMMPPNMRPPPQNNQQPNAPMSIFIFSLIYYFFFSNKILFLDPPINPPSTTAPQNQNQNQ